MKLPTLMATPPHLLGFLLTLHILLISFVQCHAASLPHHTTRLEQASVPLLARTPQHHSTASVTIIINPISNNDSKTLHPGDALSLLEFKKGITSDPLGNLSNWDANTSYCQWFGVVCNSSNSRVRSITLPNLRLRGSISPAVGSLAFLDSLDLSSNLLSGSIPPEVANCTRLMVLKLQHNNLTGTIPPALADCPVLLRILLAHNQLSGSIPAGLFHLPLLGELDASFNRLNGSLPNTPMTSSTYLTMIKLNDNRLSGSLPLGLCTNAALQGLFLNGNRFNGDLSNLVNCSSLRSLGVGFNNLQGSIPAEFGSFARLLVLDLSENQLSGPIPPTLGNCSQLIALALFENRLTGPVPDELGNLANLQLFFLNLNNLTGIIPPSLGNCTQLVYLSLNNNQLTGTIPPELGRLKFVSEVRLFLNTLSGLIPTSLYNCTRITTLGLDGNQLTGSLLPEIRTLQSLRSLSLTGNRFTGSIPYEIGECQSLQNLLLTRNNFSGSLPDSIGSLTLLEGLALISNSLVGPLPPTLSNLENLVALTLTSNNFNGSINALQLGESLSRLTALYLGGNQFTGGIPDAIGNCENLTVLRLNDNKFTGSIPASLGKLQLLIEFSSSGNQLAGAIPAEIGSCSALRLLNLAYNRLSGRLPATLGKLLSLSTVLNVSHNILSGQIPAELGNLQLLVSMDLSQNQFSKSIPNALGSGVMLQTLNLSSNNLTGPIPNSFGSLLTLKSLDLSHNALNGSIPLAISKLPNLTHFNVSHNQLVGRIPESPTFQNLTKESFLENPGLCGAILQKSCTQNSNRLTRIVSLASSVSLIVIVAGIIGAMYLHRRKLEYKHMPIYRDLAKSIRMISEGEVREATNGFRPDNIIGSGGFSTVYKGRLQQEEQVVAIKVLKLNQEPTRNTIADKMFLSELKALVELRHRNLVRVVGCCLGMEIKAIVLQHIPNGSLEEWLHSNTRRQLHWKERVAIASGIAQGLLYLHHEHDRLQQIVHCDLKPSNILLDEDMQPHIADFGIARIVQEEGDLVQTMTGSTLQGSIGYMAPEYGFHAKPNIKGDVYSYGVVLLELITGKRPNCQNFGECVTLQAWTLAHLQNNDTEAYADPALMESLRLNPDADAEAAGEQIGKLAKVGLMCTSEAAEKRPTMQQVVKWIEGSAEEIEQAGTLSTLLLEPGNGEAMAAANEHRIETSW